MFLQKSVCGKNSSKINLNYIHTLIVEYTIDQFFLTKCQMKRYEHGYIIQNNQFSKNGGPSTNSLLA